MSALDNSLETQQLRTKSGSNLNSMIIMISILNGFCALFNAHLLFKWDYKIIIVYCCVAQFTIMIYKLLKNRSFSQQCCFNIFESLLLVSFLLALVYFYEIEKININIIAYGQLVLQFLILAVTVLISKGSSDNDTQTQSVQIQEILICSLKSVISLQLVFISLRITSSISWGWIQIFIIIWFLLGLFFLINICLFIDLIQKTKTINNNIDVEKRMIIICGCIWLNLVIFGLCIIPFITLFGFSLLKDLSYDTIPQYALGTTLIFFVIQLSFFYRYKQQLILQVSQMTMSRPQQQEEDIEGNRISIQIRKFHRVSISKVPQFMVKLSQTYYRSASNATKVQSPRQENQNIIKKNENKIIMENDNSSSKRFDLLLSSPRQRLEISELVPETTRCKIAKQQQQQDEQSSCLSKSPQQINQQTKLCLICYEKEANMINMPCGHGGFCQECSQLLLHKSELCYLCRKLVTHTLLVQDVENRESLVEVIKVLEQDN